MVHRANFASTYRLRLPSNLEDQQLSRLLGAWSAGLRPVGIFRPAPVVRLRVRASSESIEHFLDVDHSGQIILGRLRSQLPGVRIEEVEAVALEPTEAVELRLGNPHRPLRTDRAEEISSALLGALTDLFSGDVLELQWIISGPRGVAPARKVPTSDRDRAPIFHLLSPRPSTWHHESPDVRQETLKQSEPLLVAVGRIGAKAKTPERARSLIAGVLRSLQMSNAPGVGIGVRSQFGRSARRRFSQNSVPDFSWPLLLNAAELASLVGWPVGETMTPGLSLEAARQLPASRALLRSSPGSVVIGESTFPGTTGPLHLGRPERLSHLHVIGPTGVGKSTLLANLAQQSMKAGDGLVVIDPKGDLVADIAARIPDKRIDDVVILDPSDSQRPVGLNPLQAPAVAPDVVVDHIVSVFADLFRRSWGPRTADVLRASLLTLVASNQPATLLDLPELLANPTAQRKRLASLPQSHPVRSFWSWYQALSDAERAAVIGPLMNKLRAFTLRDGVRGVMGQAEPRFQIEELFTKRRILLVPLPAGVLGEEASQLIGSLLVARLWQDAQSRASVPASKRRPTWLVLDEFQNFLRLPTRMGDMLAQARGLGLGLTLAHQHLGQLGSEVQADVLANARSRLVFQTGHKDAATLAKELPGVEAGDLIHLEPFELYARLLVDSQAIAPASARSLPLADSAGDGRAIRDRSRQRFGIDRTEIDAELATRTDHSDPDTAATWSLGDIEVDEPDEDLGGTA